MKLIKGNIRASSKAFFSYLHMTVDSFWEVNRFNLKECIFGRTETCEVEPSLCEGYEQRHVNAIPANNITITFHKLRDTGRFYANISWIPSPGKFIRISRICNVQFKIN